jgi:hypothetical protein
MGHRVAALPSSASPGTTAEDSAVVDEKRAASVAEPGMDHLPEVVVEVPALQRPAVEALAELAVDVVPAASDVTGEPPPERGEAVSEALPRGQSFTPGDDVSVRVEPEPAADAVLHPPDDLAVASLSALDHRPSQVAGRHS